MIFKLLGQLLLASSFVQIIPTDASTLASRAGFAEFARPHMASVLSTATLPQAEDKAKAPTKIDLDSYGIVTSAASAIVVDDDSGAVLFAKRPDEQRAFGSIVKLMSMLVFLETQPDLSQWVTLTSEDYIAGGRVYLRFDDPVLLLDVVKASLVGSDNTATQSLARLSGLGTEAFVARMNAMAQERGMQRTHFADVSGISGYNISTARDLSVLLRSAQANDTMRDIMPLQEVVLRQESGYEVAVVSTNELLGTSINEGGYHILAGKTGYIPQAGYCLASTVQHEGKAIRVVALGAATKAERFSDVKGLATWAFQTYSWE